MMNEIHVSDKQTEEGIYFVKTTFDDGTQQVRKIFIGK